MPINKEIINKLDTSINLSDDEKTNNDEELKIYNKQIKALLRDFSYKIKKLLLSNNDNEYIINYHNEEKDKLIDALYNIECEIDDNDLTLSNDMKQYIESVLQNEKKLIIDFLD